LQHDQFVANRKFFGAGHVDLNLGLNGLDAIDGIFLLACVTPEIRMKQASEENKSPKSP
jgi:hypothetical protein